MRMARAFDRLTPERGSRTGDHAPGDRDDLIYQVGEWATAHIIRHNQQAKRVLEGVASGRRVREPPAASLQEQSLARDAEQARGFLDASLRARSSAWRIIDCSSACTAAGSG